MSSSQTATLNSTNSNSNSANSNTGTRSAKPPPTGPAPLPPAANSHPPNPNSNINGSQNHAPPPANNVPNNNNNGARPGGHQVNGKGGKKKEPTPIDPATMYESLKNRIAALEEEEVAEEEEERRYAEEAQKSVVGMGENAIHAKYIEMFAEYKRMEREHQKEKQKLTKDKDAAKGQLTKANQTKTKMENLARELQKDNKRLREDGKKLAESVDKAHEEILQMKKDMSRRADKAKTQEIKYREMPEIVVKVVCRYREELFFRISRKTKLLKLFNAWTERMETREPGIGTGFLGKKPDAGRRAGADAASTYTTGSGHASTTGTQFVFTHSGRKVDAEQTPEEAGIEEGDEILAVELMDLTEGPGTEVVDEREPRRHKLKKHWNDNPAEAVKTLEEIFDGVIRERLKEVLRQYELRERHFECVIRSKELEVLLSRARAAEQKQLCEGEKARADKLEEEIQKGRKELSDANKAQAMLFDKLISCCKDPNSEKTQRLFASLREELEKRGKGHLVNGSTNG